MSVTVKPLSRPQIAWRIAQDIEDGNYVNLGIGMPEMVSNHLPDGREIVFHSENGILGMGPKPPEGEEDYDLINAGKKPVTMIPGGSFCHHADSFSMIRGGHLDICVLGAFQVSRRGDLANWSTGRPDALPAVGGAMDLAVGAKRVFAMTTHMTKEGEPKIVDECSYPLTGVECIDTIYTDLAVIDVTSDGLSVREMVEDMEFDQLQEKTATPIRLANDWRRLAPPDGLH
jgi:3-oxoadipate CoA-transferase, beta subunit